MKTAYVLATLVLLIALATSQALLTTPPEPQLIEWSEYESLAATDNTVVIDVFKPGQEPLPYTDYQIPYDDQEAIQEAIPKKNTPVLLYCKGGISSAKASEQLTQAGYKNIYELAGGSNAYHQKTVAASSCQAN